MDPTSDRSQNLPQQWEPGTKKRTLAMFPGQGSQFVGMGRDLLDDFPYIKETFEEAEDAAGFGIRKLCFCGPEVDLTRTANQQPCILAVATAMWRIIQNESSFEPDYFAGHSLGEYSALVAAGKFSLTTAVKLVRSRGQAMQEAVPEGIGAMAAVMNCEASILSQKCEEFSVSQDSSVEIVNFNSPQQLIISGHKRSVESVCASLTDVPKVRCTVLPVSAPFHSKLMVPAREAMTPLLQAARLVDTEGLVIANLTGKIEADYSIQMLIRQIDSPVLWVQCLQSAFAADCGTYLEIGPGRVLFSLARRGLPKGVTILHTADIKATIQKFQ